MLSVTTDISADDLTTVLSKTNKTNDGVELTSGKTVTGSFDKLSAFKDEGKLKGSSGAKTAVTGKAALAAGEAQTLIDIQTKFGGLLTSADTATATQLAGLDQTDQNSAYGTTPFTVIRLISQTSPYFSKNFV